MNKSVVSLIFCIIAFAAMAGDVHKRKAAPVVETPSRASQPIAANKEPDADSLKAAKSMTEPEVRTELKWRKKRLKDEEGTLKHMFASRDFTGGTAVLRSTALDRKRVSRLEKRLDDLKGNTGSPGKGEVTVETASTR